uniref:Uncharacterized protein n=1 Tax=Leptobrachium leishanense TaxID=445787 RepID=A0A8C5P9B7_9ANUR
MSPGEPGRIQAGLHNVIGVNWNGNQNLFLHLLGAPVKDKSDVDPKPDIVWPCAATIRCSAVSFSSYLALGLEDVTLTIWDLKYSGFPLTSVALPEGKSFGSLHFLECHTANRHCSPTPRAQLLVCCADESLYLITAGGDTATSLAHLRLRLGSDERIFHVVREKMRLNEWTYFFTEHAIAVIRCAFSSVILYGSSIKHFLCLDVMLAGH